VQWFYSTGRRYYLGGRDCRVRMFVTNVIAEPKPAKPDNAQQQRPSRFYRQPMSFIRKGVDIHTALRWTAPWRARVAANASCCGAPSCLSFSPSCAIRVPIRLACERWS
jgi:hypothetical protein